jgi:hypothetical protein
MRQLSLNIRESRIARGNSGNHMPQLQKRVVGHCSQMQMHRIWTRMLLVSQKKMKKHTPSLSRVQWIPYDHWTSNISNPSPEAQRFFFASHLAAMIPVALGSDVARCVWKSWQNPKSRGLDMHVFPSFDSRYWVIQFYPFTSLFWNATTSCNIQPSPNLYPVLFNCNMIYI